MAKKSPSNAVKNAVESVVAPPVVESTERGAKQFTIEDYVREYKASYAAEETIQEMAKRTGMRISNIRQTIYQFGKRCCEKRLAKVNADPVFLKALEKKKLTPEEYVSQWWSKEMPPLKHSETRNTLVNQLSDDLADAPLEL